MTTNKPVPGLGRAMTKEEASALLLELGKPCAEVAANLTLLGHKGVRGSRCNCPVALYLQAHGAPTASVGGIWAYLALPDDEDKRRASSACRPRGSEPRLPLAVRNFVEKFDGGAYPELELDPVEGWALEEGA